MLQWFVKKGCKVLGVDPAKSAVDIALSKGVASLPVFFNAKMAEKFEGAFDLICNINTLAHQPDLNDFVRGMKIALAPDGVITCEFPHLVNLIDGLQYDTIYHEHYSYFSFATICRIFQSHGLEVFDVDQIPEHGGSLRIYARHEESYCYDYTARITPESNRRNRLLHKEIRLGVDTLEYYADFQKRCEATKTDVLEFLRTHKSVGAYGAAAKGNTFLNYCGITPDMIPYVVDRSPIKQGMYLPGSQIPVVDENLLKTDKPEYILILSWNLKDEIMEQLSYAKDWGGRFVVAIPNLEIMQ